MEFQRMRTQLPLVLSLLNIVLNDHRRLGIELNELQLHPDPLPFNLEATLSLP